MKEQIDEMRKDLIEIFDEEYEKRRMITPDFTAEKMTAKGYRKQSEVEKLENKLFTELFESVLFSLVYLSADGKWHTKRNNAEKTTAIIERYLKLVAIEKVGSE